MTIFFKAVENRMFDRSFIVSEKSVQEKQMKIMLNKLFIFTGIKAVNFKYNLKKKFFHTCPFFLHMSVPNCGKV